MFYTDENGRIELNGPEMGELGLRDGWFRVKELEPLKGFAIADPDTQEAFVPAGQGHTFVFRNRPLSAICVWKYDSVHPNLAIEGAVFQIRYLSGNTSGTGGTIIGTYRTSANGSFTATGLQKGSYIIEELSSDGSHVIDTPPQTVYLSGEEQEVVQVYFGNSPKGSLLIKKVDASNGQPLSDVEFMVTTTDGAVVGDANGKFVTDQAGTFLVDNIEPGTSLVVKETRARSGYLKDDVPQVAKIKAGQCVTLEFRNKKLGNLILHKLSNSADKSPIAGAQFKITYADGKVVDNAGGQLSSNGLYTSDQEGQIVLSGITGTLICTEVSSAPGYAIDPNTRSQTVVVNPGGDTQELYFYNTPLCSLTLSKVDSVTGKPVPGTQFSLKYASGEEIGKYTTGKDGTVTVSGLLPGSTVIATETKVPDTHVLNTTPQTIVLKSGSNAVTSGGTPDGSTGTGGGNNLDFENDPRMTLTIRKYIKGTDQEPLAGVCFKVTTGDGAAAGSGDGTFYTNSAGEIVLEGLEPGTTVIARETSTVDGFVLDGEPKSVKIKAGKEAPELIFWNERAGMLVIRKLDKITKQPLANVEFELTYADGRYVDDNYGHLSSKGRFKTNDAGEIRVPVTGTVVAKEVTPCPGYVLDEATRIQTVTVNPADTQYLVVYNEPLCSLTLTKKDAVTGKPIPNTEFTLKDGNGNIIGRYTTGSDGTVTVTGLIPNSTVVAVESKVPSHYVLDPTPHVITVRNGANSSVITGTASSGSGSNNGNDLTIENVPKTTLTIEKYLETETGNEPLKGVTFLVTDSSGAVVGSSNGEYVTGEDGRVVIPNLEPGLTITARELKVPDGVVLDSTPKSIQIKAGEGGQTLRFVNKMAGTLVIRKLDKITGEPLSGVEFELTYAEGGYVDDNYGHLSSKGRFKTNDAGEIRVPVTGTVVAKELTPCPGYVLDEATRIQTVTVNPADTQTITFYNTPVGGAEIVKVDEADRSKRLANVSFEIRKMDGALVDIVTTGSDGRVQLDLPAGDYYAVETRAAENYRLDEAPTYFTVEDGKHTVVTITNKVVGGVEIIKVDEADRSKRLANVSFEIRKMDGALVDTVTTGSDGRVQLDLPAGDYYAVETRAAEKYRMDDTPTYFTVTDGKCTVVTITNRAFSGVLIHKIDAATRKGIYGVAFLLYDGNMNPVDQFTTDQDGYAYVDTLELSGKVYLRELSNKGYIVDEQLKTVYVKPGETTEITWENTAVTGQIQITKTSAEYNTMNGWPAGAPLPNTEFEIYDRANNLVDTVKTDKNGLASSRPLLLGRYKVVESKSADFYGLDKTPIEAEIEFAGQIVRVAMTNRSLYTNVSITKRGYSEVVPGQSIKYDFSGIANNSTSALTSFYWRDTLPTQAARLDKIVTGTYNVPGNYKIVYKTNLSSEYRTLADNVSTQQNRVYLASPAALGLAANECVTEFMCVFGVVPSNFRQVEAPAVYCNVLSGLTGGTQFVNQADVGGMYNGQWIMATDRWVTTVYKPGKPLPRTGY